MERRYYHHSLCRRGSRGPCGICLPLDIDEVGAQPVENVVQQTEHLDMIRIYQNYEIQPKANVLGRRNGRNTVAANSTAVSSPLDPTLFLCFSCCCLFSLEKLVNSRAKNVLLYLAHPTFHRSPNLSPIFHRYLTFSGCNKSRQVVTRAT